MNPLKKEKPFCSCGLIQDSLFKTLLLTVLCQDHKRKQKFIPSKDVKQALADFARKQELKRQLKALQASVPCEEIQDVRARVRFFTQFGLPRDPFDPEQVKPRNEPNVYLDGTTRDSKSEIIISLLLELLKITAPETM